MKKYLKLFFITFYCFLLVSLSACSLFSINKTLEISVLNVYDTKQIGEYHKTDYNFVVVELKITNIGNQEEYVYKSELYYYSNNKQYKYNFASYYLEDSYFSGTIGAGLSVTIKLVYETPAEHQSTDYIQYDNFPYKDEQYYMT